MTMTYKEISKISESQIYMKKLFCQEELITNSYSMQKHCLTELNNLNGIFSGELICNGVKKVGTE